MTRSGPTRATAAFLGSALNPPPLEALTRRYGPALAKALLAESREARDFLTCFNVGRLGAGVPSLVRPASR